MKLGNIDYAVFRLLNILKIKITKTTVVDCLENHPQYPSLLSISDCLAELGVPNQAFQVDVSEFKLEELYFPFIAYLPENGGRYIVVKKIDDEVYFSDDLSGNQAIPLEEFLKRWEGVALYGSVALHSGEKGYLDKRILEILRLSLAPIVMLSLIGLFFLNFASQPVSLTFVILCVIKMIGLGFTLLLVFQSINSNNPLVVNLCKLGGTGNDCNVILKSDAAKITSWLSWSEVGLFYFAGSLLALIWLPASEYLLSWLNVFALPYTIYSIVYQYRHKNWCVLCCAVQGLLVLEFVNNISFSNFSNAVNLNIIEGFSILLSFFIPVMIWLYLKPILIDLSQVSSLKRQLNKFKYNNDLFFQALKNQPHHLVSKEVMPIIIGNISSKNVITMVSNPFCPPCAKTHAILDSWLKHEDDILIEMIFTSSSYEDDPKNKFSQHLSALSQFGDEKLLKEALIDWYNSDNKDYNSWAVKYPVKKDKGDLSLMTESHRKWCEIAKIEYTPTILLNGYKLPDPYKLEDLRYLI